jgi:hypothetical protein
MEPESFSQHSQAPATCPYPEPAQSSLHTHIPLFEDPSYYYPPIYASLPSPYVLHAPPISFFSILSPTRYWVRSTDHSTPHYVTFSIPLLPLEGTTPTFSFRSWVKSLKSCQFFRKCEGYSYCFSPRYQTGCSPLHPLYQHPLAWHSFLCIMILSAKNYGLCQHSSYVENNYPLLHWYYTEHVISSGAELHTV